MTDPRRTNTAAVVAIVIVVPCAVLGTWWASRSYYRAGQNTAAGAESSGSAEKAHADEAEHEAMPKRVRLEPAVILAAKIKTAPVSKEILTSTIELPGEIVLDPDRTARVASYLAGRIEQVSFKEGLPVKKGDTLLAIRVPELGKVRAAYASVSVRAVAARSNANRLKILRDEGIAAKQVYLDAEAQAVALEAESRALGEQLTAMGTASGSLLTVRAPIDGIVVSRDAIVGQPVTTDQTLATISDLQEVWFLGRIFERSLDSLRVGAGVEIQLNAYPRERFSGTVENIGRQVDSTARTVTARIRLTNRKDILRVGLFGTAQVAITRPVKMGEPAAVLVVPRTATTEIGGKTYVFVRQPDDDFELHEVVLGGSALGKVEVLSGLREGEMVVTDGVFTLKSVVLKSTLEDE